MELTGKNKQRDGDGMRTRQEIKEYAKGAFSAQRSTCVLGLFLVMLLVTGFEMFNVIPAVMINLSLLVPELDMEFFVVMMAMFSVILSVVAIPIMLFSMILNVNVSGFFVKVYYGQQVKFSEPYSEVKKNFGRKLGGMCWESLWIFLWAMAFMMPAMIISVIIMAGSASPFYYTSYPMFPLYAFFVPFIIILLACIPIMIKVISYSMTHYILASNPNVKATDAIKLSMRMTKGHKGMIFVMWLSFVGWQILSVFTLGLLGIFYVYPYMQTSLAGLFVELRSLAVSSGEIHPSELDGVPPNQMQYYQHYQYTPEQQYTSYQQQPQYTQYPHYTQYPQQQPMPQAPYYIPEPMQQPMPQAPHYVPEPMQNPIPQAPQYVQQPQIPQAPPIPEPPSEPQSGEENM